MKSFTRLAAILLFGISQATSAEVSQRDLETLMPGKWHASFTHANATVNSTIIFATDGTVIYEGEVTEDGYEPTPIRIVGHWQISGNTFAVTIVETSLPESSPVGSVQRNTILAISSASMTYRGDEGVAVTVRRDNGH